MEATTKQEWIPVSERLPDKSGLYLIWAPSVDDDNPFRFVAWYDCAKDEWFGIVTAWLEVITHWMPFPGNPELPKEG